MALARDTTLERSGWREGKRDNDWKRKEIYIYITREKQKDLTT